MQPHANPQDADILLCSGSHAESSGIREIEDGWEAGSIPATRWFSIVGELQESSLFRTNDKACDYRVGLVVDASGARVKNGLA